MKTLKQITDKINDSGRATQDANRNEIIDILDVIADNIINKKATMADAYTLIAIRNGLMTGGKKVIEEIKILSEMASTLGRKGGSSTSAAKRKASAENGKKGGRPKVKRGEVK